MRYRDSSICPFRDPRSRPALADPRGNLPRSDAGPSSRDVPGWPSPPSRPRSESIEMIIRIAEMNDPDGLPGFWDVARLEADLSGVIEDSRQLLRPWARPSFALAWHPVDATSDDTRITDRKSTRTLAEVRS